MELEALIRKIIREEIENYLSGKSGVNNIIQSEPTEPEMVYKTTDGKSFATDSERIDYLLEQSELWYDEGLKIDNGVSETYAKEIEKYGKVMTLDQASSILKISKSTIRGLTKTDPNFPRISGNKVATGRLFYWLNGGEAYWLNHVKELNE